MFGWVFEPFAGPQGRFVEYYDSTTVLGIAVVHCRNERGLRLYVGPWLVQLTWVRKGAL